jgi:hypothetical protein
MLLAMAFGWISAVKELHEIPGSMMHLRCFGLRLEMESQLVRGSNSALY